MDKIKLFMFPLLSSLILYLAFHLVLYNQADQLISRLFSLDFLIQYLIGLMLFAIARHELLVPIQQGIEMCFFYLATPIKTKFFTNLPFGPNDYPALRSLIDILPAFEKAVIVTVLVIAVVLFVYNFKVDRKRKLVLIGIFALFPVMLYLNAGEVNNWLDERYSYQIWNKGYNYVRQGGTVFFINETVRILSDNSQVPDQSQLRSSIRTLLGLAYLPSPNLKQQQSDTVYSGKRNVHLIVIESFIDPVATFGLDKYHDPFFKPFRRLYELGGSSTSLSPVYTGGTANAEFEILCGLPILEGKIAFEYEINNENPHCLPNVLAAAGYNTTASHPNIRNFWNRNHAYPWLGFQNYFYDSSFEFTDKNGDFLSDASLYTQNDRFTNKVVKPLFNYVLTISNHYPYQLSHRRSKQTYSDYVHLNGYLNMLHHSTKELYQYLTQLQVNDPDAVIVVVGDHGPYFGPDMTGYIEHSEFSPNQGLGATELVRLTSTPLLLIDGQNGPVSVGRIAHYEIPRLIYSALSMSVPYSQDLVLHNGDMHVRPIPGYPLLIWRDETMLICKGDARSESCETAKVWQSNINVLRSDLLIGRQYQFSTSRKGLVNKGVSP